MPAEIVNKINAAVVKGFQDPDARQRLERDAIDAQPLNPAEFAAFFKSENAKWGPLAKEVLGPDVK
jgi:tripartite-type tricarboxylate transporter receptor subunit TctC